MPYARVFLGPHKSVRVADLRAEHALEIECSRCRHKALVAPHRLHERFHRRELLTRIANVMRCTKCKAEFTIEWQVVVATSVRPEPGER